MGQQQLLLIVLGVIIVGVAIVAGISLFNAGSEEATKDELVAQCMNIGANAQQWYKKPTAMGGGNLSFVGYTIPTKMATTVNGGYTVAPAATNAVITATPSATLGYTWTVTATVTPTGITTVIN